MGDDPSEGRIFVWEISERDVRRRMFVLELILVRG